jgi:superfamily II DNA/RNA helicase
LYVAAAIHGDKTQNERTKIMHAFKSGNLPILVATDVACKKLKLCSLIIPLRQNPTHAHAHAHAKPNNQFKIMICFFIIE